MPIVLLLGVVWVRIEKELGLEDVQLMCPLEGKHAGSWFIYTSLVNPREWVWKHGISTFTPRLLRSRQDAGLLHCL